MTTDTERPPSAVSHSGPPAPLSQHETIELVLRPLNRHWVPIRKSFVQQGKGKDTKPGPLAKFVPGHDERGLDTYLLLHALASAPPWNCDLPSGFWVRALGLADPTATGTKAIDNARPAVSKITTRLVERELVARTRVKRRSSLTLMCEDGSGTAYEHPHDTNEQWFSLPHEYWFEHHYTNLSLRAKVMLLIALERPDNFTLAQNKVPGWYGISEDTAFHGLRELRDVGLLHVEPMWVESARSDIGYTQQWVYSLQGAFSVASRNKASRIAKTNYTGPVKETT